jgi:hypothetical protein
MGKQDMHVEFGEGNLLIGGVHVRPEGETGK